MSLNSYRRWQSNFANNLKKLETVATVEEAIAKITQKKLVMAGQTKPPIRLDMVASTVGIMPTFSKVEMAQDARLVISDGKLFVQVNALHVPTKQRFSAAHEISHKIFAVGKSLNDYYCNDVGSFAYLSLSSLEKKEEEIVCDIGASYLLLLNKQYLQPILLELGFSYQAVKHVEENFEVSFEAAIRAISEISLDNIAAIYFRLSLTKDEEEKLKQPLLFPGEIDHPLPKLRVAKYYKSKELPISIIIRKSIDERSCIYQAFNSKESFKAREIITFDERTYYEMDIEAIPRTAYFGGELDQAVVALISNIKTL